MANPLGESMFNPEPQYGEVLQQQALLHAAPISGAPATPATKTPAPTPGGGGMPPMQQGIMVDPYYQRLTDTWRAISKLPGASSEVKALARRSAQIQEVQQR